MAVVVPKLYFESGVQVPVWEITSENGKRIYYERLHRPGYVPIGSEYYPQADGTGLVVSASLESSALNPRTTWKDEKGVRHLKIHRAEDGYDAPSSWYQKLAPGGKSYEAEAEVDEHMEEKHEQEGNSEVDETWDYSDDEDDTGYTQVAH